MSRRMLMTIAAAALLLGFAGCSGSETKAAAAAPAPTAMAKPEMATAPSYDASGPIVVENQVDVEAQREGVVSQVAAEAGTAVGKGQVLGKLDDRQITADLAAADARVRSIQANISNWEAESKVFEADYQRAQKMWDAQLITKEQLDHAKYKAEADEFEIQRERESLSQAKATRDSLALEREKTRILAPFSGVVARRYVRVGQKVAVGDKLFWVTETAPLEVRFTLPAKYVETVKPGQAITVTAADISPETKHAAKILRVSPVVDPSSGTIEVLAQISEKAGDLRPGMTANVRLQK